MDRRFEFRQTPAMSVNTFGRVLRFKIRGFLAWWVWRSYYLAQMPRFERKLRIVLDWTIALFFHYDIVKLDLYCEEYPHGRGRPRAGRAGAKPAPAPRPRDSELAVPTLSGRA